MSAGDRALAGGLFDHARTLLAVDRYDEACPKLVESQRLDPQLGTLLYLASCHEGQGRLATAWSEFGEARSWAERVHRLDRERAAGARMAELAPKVPRLVLEVAANVVNVTLDGRPLAASARGTPLPLDPGEHVVVASTPGRTSRTATFTAAPDGKTTTLRISTLDLASEAVSPAPPSAAPEPTSIPAAPGPLLPSTAARADRWPAWLGPTLTGVGVAGLAVGVGFGLAASHDKGAANACPPAPKPCADADAVDADHAAHREATVATAAVVVGAVFLAAGVYVVLTRKPSGANIALAPFGAGARLKATF